MPRSNHGTGEQAIDWLLNVNRDSDSMNNMEFLRAWQNGEAEKEWPEFYEWLDKQS